MQEDVFHEVADEFINLANDLTADWAEPMLSAAILYAAARFNAHHFLRTDGEPGNREAALDYYSDQYRRMLKENLAELIDQA